MKKLIYVIPGLLCDVKSSPFNRLYAEADSIYDVMVHDAYYLVKEKNLSDLVSFLEDTLAKLNYESIHLISHSAGSDLVLQANFGKNVKSVVFWSPSMMFPQNVSDTFPKKDGLLCLGEGIYISEELGRDFDELDTRILLKRFTLPHVSFLTRFEPHDPEWGVIIPVPYEHNYTYTEMSNLMAWAKSWFSAGSGTDYPQFTS